MSGDSPSSHATETIFDFSQGRHSPIPTTSKEHNIVTASVLVEQPPKKDEEKEQEAALLNSPIVNNTCESVDDGKVNEETLKLNDARGCDDGKGDVKKQNGPADMLDGKWIPAPDVKQNDKEEEECAVKCLYYTMQCCECTIL